MLFYHHMPLLICLRRSLHWTFWNWTYLLLAVCLCSAFPCLLTKFPTFFKAITQRCCIGSHILHPQTIWVLHCCQLWWELRSTSPSRVRFQNANFQAYRVHTKHSSKDISSLHCWWQCKSVHSPKYLAIWRVATVLAYAKYSQLPWGRNLQQWLAKLFASATSIRGASWVTQQKHTRPGWCFSCANSDWVRKSTCLWASSWSFRFRRQGLVFRQIWIDR